MVEDVGIISGEVSMYQSFWTSWVMMTIDWLLIVNMFITQINVCSESATILLYPYFLESRLIKMLECMMCYSLEEEKKVIEAYSTAPGDLWRRGSCHVNSHLFY